MTPPPPTSLARRIRALGPWFHNLVLDGTNPRSLDFQLSHLADLYKKLPRHTSADLDAVGHALELLRGVNLEGVGANDLATALPRHFRGDLRFPDTRRADDEERALHATKNKNGRPAASATKSPVCRIKKLARGLVLARLRAADQKLATKEILVVQLADRALRFFHGVHLHKGETFRALVVFVGHNLRVLHLADAVEELEEIALRGFERQVAHVKTGRGDFD